MAKKRQWKTTLDRRWVRNYLINQNGCICGICHFPIDNLKDVSIDHIIPRARGGMDVLENYQLAHYSCNFAKKYMLPEEFELLQRGAVHA